MVIEVEPVVENLEEKVMKVFLKAIEILGGPKKLIEHRHLTWLPSLMEACYAMVMRDLAKKTEEEIAKEIGVASQTVKKIFESDPELVMKRLSGELSEEEFKEHIAGGLAKIAWKEIKSGKDEFEAFIRSSREALEACEGPTWAIHVLMRIKGTDFPIDSSDLLAEKLKGITAKGKNLEDVVREIEYPISNPAELLKKLAIRLKE